MTGSTGGVFSYFRDLNPGEATEGEDPHVVEGFVVVDALSAVHVDLVGV